MSLTVGAVSQIITPDLGNEISGQMHRRFAEHVRDDLEINIIYIENSGVAVALINLDHLGVFPAGWWESQKRLIFDLTGIPVDAISISSTHTHSGPDCVTIIDGAQNNMAFLSLLEKEMPLLVQKAKAEAVCAQAGMGSGQAEIGYNRRLCYNDGSHSMYGDVTRADFNGFEGGNDPEHTVLYFEDMQGELIGVIHNNASHSTCVENSNFFSADFPGEARRLIRKEFSDSLPVLYLQGASGDTSPWDLIDKGFKRDGEKRLKEIGALLAATTLQIIRDTEVSPNLPLSYVRENLTLEVRLPTPDKIAEAEKFKKQGIEVAGNWNYNIGVHGVLGLNEAFKDDPRDHLSISAISLGDLSIVTNPCELYCQFGLDIKHRSPSRFTMISQLSDGFSGYVHTVYGFLGGGYSGDAIFWTRFTPIAGYEIVEHSSKLLNQVCMPKKQV